MFAQGMHGKGWEGSDCGDCGGNQHRMMRQHGPMDKPGMHQGMMKKGMYHDGWMRAIKELDLTDAQDKDIRDIMEESKKSAITANAAIEILHMDMQKNMKALNFKEAMKISDQLTNAKGEMHKAKIKVMEKVYNKLTDAQKEELKKIKEDCQDAPKMKKMHRK